MLDGDKNIYDNYIKLLCQNSILHDKNK